MLFVFAIRQFRAQNRPDFAVILFFTRFVLFFLVSFVIFKVLLVLFSTIDHLSVDVTIGYIIIIFKVQVVFNGPTCKFIEQNRSKTISVSFLPLCIRVPHIDAPLLEHRRSISEFNVTNFLVAISVQAVESNPVLIVLSEILQKITVLILGDVVVALF